MTFINTKTKLHGAAILGIVNHEKRPSVRKLSRSDRIDPIYIIKCKGKSCLFLKYRENSRKTSRKNKGSLSFSFNAKEQRRIRNLEKQYPYATFIGLICYDSVCLLRYDLFRRLTANQGVQSKMITVRRPEGCEYLAKTAKAPRKIPAKDFPNKLIM